MCIHRYLSKLKLYWSNNYFLAEQVNLKYLSTVKALDARLFKKYSINSACMFKMRVIYKNLETYIRKLQYINQFLSENRLIKNDWCKYNYLETSLEKFLIDDFNVYSNPVETIERFKQEYITYCKFILEIEKETLGEEGHNTRILIEFSNHLNSITLFLLKYSHEQ